MAHWGEGDSAGMPHPGLNKRFGLELCPQLAPCHVCWLSLYLSLFVLPVPVYLSLYLSLFVLPVSICLSLYLSHFVLPVPVGCLSVHLSL